MTQLEDFSAEARAFVASHHPPATEASPTSDQITVIPEKPAAQEAEELLEAVRWRQICFDAGFGWIDGPREHGGRELPAEFASTYRDIEQQYSVPDEAYTRFSVGIFCPTLFKHASPGLKDQYLSALRRADLIACQLYSEPDAGSDLASVRTRAERQGDEWLVNGQKVWTSSAHYSQLGMLLARTDPDSKRNSGLTVFLVDMAQEGIEIRPIHQMTGGASFSEVFLDNVRVPHSNIIGEVGDGWKVINTTLRHERAVIGSDGGVDIALVPRLVELARSTGAWEDSAIRDKIGEIYAHARGNQLMTQRFLRLAGADGLPGPEMSLSKLQLTDNLQRISDLAQRLLGSSYAANTGEHGTYGWNQLAMTLPGLRIGGGTDQIMRTIIAQRVLGLPRS